MEMSTGVVALILTLVVVIFFAIISKITEPRRQELLKNYTFENGVLNITKRDPILQIIIKVFPYYSAKMAYKPEEYVYASATVGGVATGGVHKKGGYSYIASMEKTNKYELVYCELGRHQRTINAIQLTPELAEEARQCDQIKSFLYENRLVLSLPSERKDQYEALVKWLGGENPSEV